MQPRPCHPEWSEAESNFFVRDPKRCYAPFDPRYARISTTLRMTRTKKRRATRRRDLGRKGEQMYYVYILTNKTDTVMYIGVTNDLRRRLYEHKNEQIEGFTKKYHVHKLVYFEEYSEINDAISREKQLKRWVRSKKNWLVETKNPYWDDWSEGFI